VEDQLARSVGCGGGSCSSVGRLDMVVTVKGACLVLERASGVIVALCVGDILFQVYRRTTAADVAVGLWCMLVHAAMDE
jgi:hypothetical protein